MRQERHHNLPLSLGGRNVPSNTVMLPHDEHRLLHDTLDIPYNTVRKYRGVLNEDMFKPTMTTVNAQYRIEKLFFARYKFLPKNLQVIVYDKLLEETKSIYKKYDKEFTLPKDTGVKEDNLYALLHLRFLLHGALIK